MDNETIASDAVDDEVIGARPSGFNSLRTDIANSYSELKLGTEYEFNGDYYDNPWKSGIEITKNNFVLDGQGHTISGSNAARIFNCIGSNITFKNINFINGQYSDSLFLLFFFKPSNAFN